MQSLQKNMLQNLQSEICQQSLSYVQDIKAEINKPVKRDYAYYEDLFTNKYEKKR